MFQNGEEKTRIERQLGVPIWSLSWNLVQYVKSYILERYNYYIQ